MTHWTFLFLKCLFYYGDIKSQNPILVHNAQSYNPTYMHVHVDIAINQPIWMQFLCLITWVGRRYFKTVHSLLLLLIMIKCMWPTSLIGWYTEWSTYFVLTFSFLWMVLMIITDDDYLTSSSDAFQPEGPFNMGYLLMAHNKTPSRPSLMGL